MMSLQRIRICEIYWLATIILLADMAPFMLVFTVIVQLVIAIESCAAE
jgi:hypothetical protein